MASAKSFMSVFFTLNNTSPLRNLVPFLIEKFPINFPLTSEEILMLFKETTLPELVISDCKFELFTLITDTDFIISS